MLHLTLDADEMRYSRCQILCWIYEETLLTLDDVRSRATAEYRKIPQNTLTAGD